MGFPGTSQYLSIAEDPINVIVHNGEVQDVRIGNDNWLRLVRNQVRCIGVHQHVLGVSGLCIAPRALQIGAEHPSATLAPFAASAGGLNPCSADAVAYLASGYIRATATISPTSAAYSR